MEIDKGKQYSVSTKFTYKGSPAVFVNPPRWTIYNSNDQIVLSGAAQPNGNIWEAVFTISKNYIVPGGKENLILQFTGHDNKNASYTTDKELTLSDLTEEFKPDGVLFNMVSNTPIRDSIVLPYETAKISINVVSAYSEAAAVVTEYSSTAVAANSSGYVHNIEIPAFVVEKNIYTHPHQIVINYGESVTTDLEIHPLYLVDARAMSYLSSLKLYLDKAKLIELDQSLQWHTSELMQSILEAYRHINSSPPEGTFWNSSTLPSVLDQFMIYAAIFHALNIRYLAEGMQKFEFTGLNTQLNYDRTEALSFKISEMQGLLERLPDAKKSAIAIGGKGDPPPGEVDRRIASVATLGLSANLLNNRINRRQRRFY